MTIAVCSICIMFTCLAGCDTSKSFCCQVALKKYIIQYVPLFLFLKPSEDTEKQEVHPLFFPLTEAPPVLGVERGQFVCMCDTLELVPIVSFDELNGEVRWFPASETRVADNSAVFSRQTNQAGST